MCRSTEFPHLRSSPAVDRLDLKAFYVRFSGPHERTPKPETEPEPGPFPDSLTLLYLPSIAGRALEIDGSKVRPDHPAFLTLHRVVTPRARRGDIVYGSRDRVRAGPGLRFEVYLGEEKALRGIFRRDEGQEWRMECACALEREILAGGDAGTRWVSEVCVAAEGNVAMSERVEMVARKRSRKSNRGFHGLEEIPEEIPEERESDSESEGSGGCCCCCGEGECVSDGRDDDEEEEAPEDGEDWEVNMEGVRWAVDVGIWVACLGVGYLVSKASAKSLRRRRLL